MKGLLGAADCAILCGSMKEAMCVLTVVSRVTEEFGRRRHKVWYLAMFR